MHFFYLSDNTIDNGFSIVEINKIIKIVELHDFQNNDLVWIHAMTACIMPSYLAYVIRELQCNNAKIDQSEFSNHVALCHFQRCQSEHVDHAAALSK